MSSSGEQIGSKDVATVTLDTAVERRQRAGAAAGPDRGDSIGRYVIVERIGAGGMGVVYKAEHTMMGRVVALKVMAPHLTAKATAVDRFHREVRAAARLMHPNIVTVYDAGEEHDFCYIAMELLKGADLAPYVKQGQLLPVDRVVSIVARVA